MKAIISYIGGWINGIRNLYIHTNFYYFGATVVILFACSFVVEFLFNVAVILAVAGAFYTLIQAVMLFSVSIKLKVTRELTDILSLGETHEVQMKVINSSVIGLNLSLTENLPYQLQIRDKTLITRLNKNGEHSYSYSIRPTVRGVHKFGDYYCFVSLRFPFVERRLIMNCNDSVDVYPSIIQMRKFELYASKSGHQEGLKRTRRLGHGSEFEQIKQYVPGDDPRTINWKASGRTGLVMTNHYEEERSQPVYQIIDSSRVMKMPFDGLTLLDHSINSALALSNIILKKSDKAGLLSFDKKVHTILEANNSHYQLKKLLKALYNQKESTFEANYEMLYLAVRRYITKRSLVLLYTNFESIYALERVLPQLKALNKRHLLLIISFENTELSEFSEKRASNLYDIYDQTMARKLILEKNQIHSELEKHGIMNISVTTQTLTADVINKYLEIKSRGAI